MADNRVAVVCPVCRFGVAIAKYYAWSGWHMGEGVYHGFNDFVHRHAETCLMEHPLFLFEDDKSWGYETSELRNGASEREERRVLLYDQGLALLNSTDQVPLRWFARHEDRAFLRLVQLRRENRNLHFTEDDVVHLRNLVNLIERAQGNV